MKDDVIVGYLDSPDGKIIIYGNDYSFIFAKSENHSRITKIVPDIDGYIWAKMADGSYIGIHAGQTIDIKDVRRLNTWSYLEVKDKDFDPKSYVFSGLRLSNGSLKSVFSCNAIEPDFENNKKDGIVYKYKDDTITFETSLDGKCVKWEFGSRITEKMSIMEGNSLENKDVCLDITFQNGCNLHEIQESYRITERLISFLTFQREVEFKKIELLREGDYGTETIGNVNIRIFDNVEVREFVEVINVVYLKEVVFDNLVKTLSSDDLKTKGLPLEILPDGKRNEYRVTVGRIRAICSALEMELDARKVAVSKNDELEKLVNEIKGIIKNHRKKLHTLSDKTYDSISGSLAHWNNPLAERIIKAWNEHVEILRPFLCRYGIDVFDEDINAFVKARNNVTHNGLISLDNKVVNTAFVLMALTYVCTLERMGMETKYIEDIMGKRLFR